MLGVGGDRRAGAVRSCCRAADAGRVAGRAVRAWRRTSASCVGAAAGAGRRCSSAAIAPSAAGGSRFSAELVLALGALFCIVAGHFALQPMMEAARAGQGSLSFGALHARRRPLLRAQAGCWSLALAWRLTARAGLTLSPAATLLDAGDALLGALQLAAGGEAHVAEHLDLLDLRPVVAALRELEHLDHLRPGHRGRRARPSPSAAAARQSTSSLPMCWTGAALERVGQLGEQRFAGGAVVGEDAHLDQAVGVQRGVDLLAHGRRSGRRRRSRRPGRGDGPRRAFPCARRE